MGERKFDHPGPEVRINFKLSRDESPLLTEELLKSRKGRSRHARLVTLASIGLVAEKGALKRDGALLADPSTNKAATHAGSATDAYQRQLDDEDIERLAQFGRHEG
jgi:hypothetical protein